MKPKASVAATDRRISMEPTDKTHNEAASVRMYREEKTNMLQRVMATWVVTTKRNISMMANR